VLTYEKDDGRVENNARSRCQDGLTSAEQTSAIEPREVVAAHAKPQSEEHQQEKEFVSFCTCRDATRGYLTSDLPRNNSL